MFYLSPLLFLADVVAYTVGTGCHPTFNLLQGLGLHAGLAIPYPGIRSLIGCLSATPHHPPQPAVPMSSDWRLKFHITTSCPLDVFSYVKRPPPPHFNPSQPPLQASKFHLTPIMHPSS